MKVFIQLLMLPICLALCAEVSGYPGNQDTIAQDQANIYACPRCNRDKSKGQKKVSKPKKSKKEIIQL